MSIFERKCLVKVKDIGYSRVLSNIGFLNLLENTACMHSEVAGCRHKSNGANTSFLGYIALEG